MVLDIGLRAKVTPDLDEREADREADKLADKFRDAGQIAPDIDTGGMESQMGDSMDGMSIPGGAAAAGSAGKSAAGGGLLSSVAKGGMLKVALAGTVGFGLLSGISKVASASPAMQKQASMFSDAMDLFFRPFGDQIAEWLSPISEGLLDTAVGFNETVSEDGLIGGTVKDIFGVDYSGGGLVERLLGSVGAGIGLGGGAKAGAMAGGALGSVVPGAGTAVGAGAGAILGGGAGLLGGALGGRIGSGLGDAITDVNWGDWIPDIAWGDWVPDVAWGDWIPEVDWGSWISNLEWPSWIPNVAWGNWIPDIAWSNWVPEVSWDGWIPTIHWTDWIPNISWGKWVPKITWNGWIPTVHWKSWISNINWTSWIPDISWGKWVPDVSWGSFIPSINWGDFIPSVGGGGGGGDGGMLPFADGGVVRSPTSALIGEAGPEAVIPLDRLENILQQRGNDQQATPQTRASPSRPVRDTGDQSRKLDAVIRELKRTRRAIENRPDPDPNSSGSANRYDTF